MNNLKRGSSLLTLISLLLTLQMVETPAVGAAESKNTAYMVPILNLLLEEPVNDYSSIVGFVLADQESVDEYHANNARSYNSTGLPISITRSQPGSYSVVFEGQSFGESSRNVQVSTVGSNHRCSFGKLNPGAIAVQCYDAVDNLVDTKFNLLVSQTNRESQAQFVAYAFLSNASSTESYTADEMFAYSIAGQLPTSRKVSTGQYTVSFAPGLVSGTNIQVSAFQIGTYCNVSSANSTSVSVKCYLSTSGELIDSNILIALARDVGSAAQEIRTTSFVAGGGDESFTLRNGAPFAFNSAGGNIEFVRQSVGTYAVRFKLLEDSDPFHGHNGIPIISDAHRGEFCFLDLLDEASAQVSCRNAQNELIDSFFRLQLIKRIE